MQSLIHDSLGIGIGFGVLLLIGILTDRRRGLPLRQGLRQRLPGDAAFCAALLVWGRLPRGWHLPLAVAMGVVCMCLLFRQALRQVGPPPGTEPGRPA